MNIDVFTVRLRMHTQSLVIDSKGIAEFAGLEIDGLEIAGLDSRKSNNRIQE